MIPSLPNFVGSTTLIKAYIAPPNQVLILGWNQLRLDTILPNHDRLNEFNVATYSFTPRNAGYYLIYAQIQGQIAVGVGFAHALEIVLNGVTIADDTIIFQIAGATNFCRTSTIQYLTPNDTIIFNALGFAAPNIVTLFAGANNSFITIHRIR